MAHISTLLYIVLPARHNAAYTMWCVHHHTIYHRNLKNFHLNRDFSAPC